MLDYAHQPDLLHWMLNETPVGVYAAGAHIDSMDLHSNPNVLSLNFDYAHPLLGTIHLNYLQTPERHEYEIVGNDGWAVLDMATSELKIAFKNRSSPPVETFKIARDSVYIAEHQSFINAINGKCAPESPAYDALASAHGRSFFLIMESAKARAAGFSMNSFDSKQPHLPNSSHRLRTMDCDSQ